MTTECPPSDAGDDATLVAQLLALDPFGLGGVVLRGGPGEQRDRICGAVRELLVAGAPFLRVPAHVSEDRLLGGVALAETLQAGRVVTEAGLLRRADGGVLVLATAERLDSRVVSHVCAALDRGAVTLEREGASGTIQCRFGVIAFDEGLDDEAAPTPLKDRLAFHIDLVRLDPREASSDRKPDGLSTQRGRESLQEVALGDDVLEALCKTASALGIVSLRAPLFAAVAARAHAALSGRTRVSEADAMVAARLVLGPRALRAPEATPTEQSPSEAESDLSSHPETEDVRADPSAQDPSDADVSDCDGTSNAPPLEEIMLNAAKSGIPSGLLDAFGSRRLGSDRKPTRGGRSGALRSSKEGGRPAGTRTASSSSDGRLNVIETLRAAAPWQRLRRRGPEKPTHGGRPRIEVRKSDFRVTKYRQPEETSVIFSVDASGSAALQRLAEAKGAVEQVLLDCYARRDHVALVAFRGTAATLLLSPTRSLARVRRSLANLAGGGMTPLAAGIDAALALAFEGRKRGMTPVLVLMTDGRANVDKAGRPGSANASSDALSSAKAVRAAGIRSLFLDTGSRPRAQARALASEMGARYLPLPFVGAAGISRHVQSLASGTL